MLNVTKMLSHFLIDTQFLDSFLLFLFKHKFTYGVSKFDDCLWMTIKLRKTLEVYIRKVIARAVRHSA